MLWLSIVKYISCFLFTWFAQTMKIFLQRKFPDLWYFIQVTTHNLMHVANYVSFHAVDSFFGPPQDA